MTKSKVIRLLSDLQPAIFKQEVLVPSRCILATSVAIDVLKEFNIDAEPLSVKVDVINAAWVACVKAGGNPVDDPNSWALSAGYPMRRKSFPPKPGPRRPGQWDGHLVVEVPDLELLLDMDSQQLNRPLKNIAFPDVMVMWHWNGTAINFEMPDGAMLRYAERRDDSSFKIARDFWDSEKRDPLVDKVVRSIRKGG